MEGGGYDTELFKEFIATDGNGDDLEEDLGIKGRDVHLPNNDIEVSLENESELKDGLIGENPVKQERLRRGEM